MVVVGATNLGADPLSLKDDAVAGLSVEGASLGAVGEHVPLRHGDSKGTSLSAPFALSVAALMVKANPAMTPDQIERVLQQTAVPIKGGLNEVNAVKAVAVAKALAPSHLKSVTPTPRRR
jgi:subtilisin family serine protease